MPTLMPTFWQTILFWLKMGLLSFGGPAGQISLMHKELVEDKRWISESRFLHALNYCMILPGLPFDCCTVPPSSILAALSLVEVSPCF